MGLAKGEDMGAIYLKMPGLGRAAASCPGIMGWHSVTAGKGTLGRQA